ncbi:YybS family protein [Clostridium sp. DJ247]|uniref:YybS family protein n=1 Tax=Clostridium sp. DJ247 TaxID=2726188 RepID=UPI0016257AF2|nr:YybS family protein [Clostridium sp. DJ247]MBC2582211.1 YybS family protein [Clostridium sp. DJ247]
MENRIYNTKALIEAGLITAIVVVITLINVYVPIFSLFGTYILPIPITLLYIRHNYKVTLGAVFVSAILISILYNPLSALTSSILFGITGMTLGYCIKNDKKVSITMLILAIGLAIGTAINFGIYISFIDTVGIVGFINNTLKTLRESIDMSKQLYIKLGVSSDQFAPIEKSLSLFTTEFVLKILPAGIIISSFVSAYLNYAITRSILKKLRYNIKEIVPFNKIYVNTRVGTIVVLFLIIGLLLSKSNMNLGGYLEVSSMFVLQFIFILDGLALAAYYLKYRFKISRLAIVLMLTFTVISQLSVIYIFLGLADMIVDFRKLDPYRRPKTE